jgi:hypothetical protein
MHKKQNKYQYGEKLPKIVESDKNYKKKKRRLVLYQKKALHVYA